MKEFKHLITELKWTGTGVTPSRDPHEEIKEIASKLPIRYVTSSGREIARQDTHDFLDEVAESVAMHDKGFGYAMEKNSQHMIDYFVAAQGTHDNLIDHISAHIHANVPEHLKNSIENYIGRILLRKSSKVDAMERISKQAGGAFGMQAGGFGKFEYDRNYRYANMEGKHPHLENEDKHLSRLF